jgi:protein-tyrosine phosphatase
VESAGLHALEDQPADPEVLRLMQGIGLDLSAHTGRQLTQEMTLAADLILVMDLEQKAWCEQVLPSSLGRVFLLGHWQSPPFKEIQDPFRQGPEAFQQAFEHIQRAVSDWPPRLTHAVRSA